jgi:hypothetical protein
MRKHKDNAADAAALLAEFEKERWLPEERPDSKLTTIYQPSSEQLRLRDRPQAYFFLAARSAQLMRQRTSRSRHQRTDHK